MRTPVCLAATGFARIDDVRRRVQQDSLVHRGRRDDPPFKIRWLLRRRADRLTNCGWYRLLAARAAGDVDQQTAFTWIAAQHLRAFYDRTRYAAEQHLHRWLTNCAGHDIPEPAMPTRSHGSAARIVTP